MPNTLVRDVVRQYVGGSPAVPEVPPYCYTEEVLVAGAGSSGGLLSGTSTSGGSSSGESYAGLQVPVYLEVDGQQTAVIIGYAPMRNGPSGAALPTYTSKTKTTCLPGSPGKPAVPPTVITTNAGPNWFAVARSIEVLDGDFTFTCVVPETPGIIVGFAVYGATINAPGPVAVTSVGGGSNAPFIMQYGLRLDHSVDPAHKWRAMIVTPGGALVSPNRGVNFGEGTQVTIAKVAGRFVAIAGGVVLHSEAWVESEQRPYFVGAKLYTADDTIDSPTITDASYSTLSTSLGFFGGPSPAMSVTGALGFDGQTNLLVDGNSAFQVRGAIGFSSAVADAAGAQVAVAGSVGLAGAAGYADDYASVSVTALGMLAADHAVAQGVLRVPTLQMDAYNTDSPVPIAGVSAFLQPVGGVSVGLTGGLAQVDMALASAVMLASDHSMGQGAVTLPRLYAYADDGFSIPNYYGHNEPLNLTAAFLVDPTLVAQINESLEFGNTLSLAAVLTGTVLEGLLLDDSVTVQALLTAAVNAGLSLQSATLAPAQVAEQLAYLVGSGAATRYTEFAFDRFARTNDGTYAIRPDGLYRLRAGDDDGAVRGGQVDFGTTNMGDTHKKFIETVYLGYATDGEVYVKLRADDGDEKIYRATGNQATKRAFVARGISAREWTVGLQVVDATEFDLDQIEFVVAASGRRWTR